MCFERLITAILFGDTVSIVDDYKPFYRERRARAFPEFKRITFEKGDYEQVRTDAAKYASSRFIAFNEGEPVDEALAFFDSLRLSPQLRWDVFVSSEYLTLSYLADRNEIRRHSALVAAFGNEATDHTRTADEVPNDLRVSPDGGRTRLSLDDFIRRYTNNNSNSKGLGHKDTLHRVIFGYGWLAERSRFYELVSDRCDLIPFLSPLRDAYVRSLVPHDMRLQASQIIRSLSEDTLKTVENVVNHTGHYNMAIRLPLFFAYLLNRTSNVLEALQLAYEIRTRREFEDIRDMIANLNHLNQSERYKEVNRVLSGFARSMDRLLKEYSVATAQGPATTVSLSFSGPSASWKGNWRQLFSDMKYQGTWRMFRLIAEDLVRVERLGALHDKATLLVREGKDASPKEPSLTPPHLRNYSGPYGRPAGGE